MTQRNPPTAVDVIIEIANKGNLEGIILIKRKNNPFKDCWALPGGFQEWGESLEQTAVREAKEETGLDVYLIQQLSVYSNPDRDPRGPVNSVGYVARGKGIPKGADDATEAKIFPLDALLLPLAFDHAKRLEEYKKWRKDNIRSLYY